jgi:sortase A
MLLIVLRSLPLLLFVVGASQFAIGAWIPAKGALAQVLLERAWQNTNEGGKRVRPWPWADTWPVARITLPRLGASWIVLSGSSGRTLAFGPGHTDGSALPGEAGAAIVSGHRDTHFSSLRELRVDDEIVVERPDGARVRYRVDELRVADSRRARLRDPGIGRARLKRRRDEGPICAAAHPRGGQGGHHLANVDHTALV